MNHDKEHGTAFRPPTLFRWMLSAFLCASDRKTVLSELEELFRRRVERDGVAPASVWLKRQCRQYPAQLIRERLTRFGLASPTRRRSGDLSRRQGGGFMLSALFRDAKLSFRGFRRSPGFVAVAVATLALGIGANAAIFSVVNGVLLKPLPYPKPDNLIAMRMTNPERGDRRIPWSLQNLQDVVDQSSTFESITGYQWSDLTLTGIGEPELINAVGVTEGMLGTLGINPMLGRDITGAETEIGSPAVAVLSHSFWQDRFGGNPSVIGRTIQLSDMSYEVVGVAPPGFEFPSRAQIWVPGRWDPETHPRGRYFLRAVGRLAPEATLETAQAELSGIAVRLEEEYPQSNASRGVALLPLAEYTTGDVRTELFIMFGAVGLVLLIACANVANLLLARGSMRVGEMAVRATLGASRAAIVRQLLVESLILSMTGALLGVFLCVWAVQALVAFSPGNIPRLDNVTIDGTVIIFSTVLAILVAVVFGTAPAFRLATISISGVVRDGRDPEAGLGQKRALRFGMLVLEMAISLMLLVGAGLLIRSFAQIQAVRLGIDPSGVQQFSLSLPEARYDGEQAAEFFKSLEERLATIPGVEAVGMVSGSPLGHSHSSIGFDIVGREPFAPENQPFFLVRRATPGYFESVRIPLLAGRSFNADDTGETPRVTVISSTAAERFFPGENPIGKQFTFDQGETSWTIVGVVGDVRSIDVTTETEPEAYFPLAQWSGDFMTVLVRTTGGVTGIVPQLRKEVATLDPLLAMYWIETLDHRVDVSVGQERFNLLLLGSFAGLALLLAAVGLYGVVAYLVTRRTREIGIRIALGACWRDVARLVLWQGMLPTVAGTALGLLGAVAGTRVLSSLLYQVEPWDPTTFVAGTTVLFTVALLACYFPARGATKIPPTEAIRVE